MADERFADFAEALRGVLSYLGKLLRGLCVYGFTLALSVPEPVSRPRPLSHLLSNRAQEATDLGAPGAGGERLVRLLDILGERAGWLARLGRVGRILVSDVRVLDVVECEIHGGRRDWMLCLQLSSGSRCEAVAGAMMIAQRGSYGGGDPELRLVSVPGTLALRGVLTLEKR